MEQQLHKVKPMKAEIKLKMILSLKWVKHMMLNDRVTPIIIIDMSFKYNEELISKKKTKSTTSKTRN